MASVDLHRARVYLHRVRVYLHRVRVYLHRVRVDLHRVQKSLHHGHLREVLRISLAWRDGFAYPARSGRGVANLARVRAGHMARVAPGSGAHASVETAA